MTKVTMPEPLEIDWPELRSQALGCGVEDRGIHDRYEAAEYGFLDAVDKCVERVPEEIFDRDQMEAYAAASVREALEEVAAIFDARANAPFPADPSGKRLMGVAFHQEWNSARFLDQFHARTIRALIPSMTTNRKMTHASCRLVC